jgi:hypothetical protein
MRYEAVRVSLGRRFAALMLDWLSCYFIVMAISGGIGAATPNRPFFVLGLSSPRFSYSHGFRAHPLGIEFLE